MAVYRHLPGSFFSNEAQQIQPEQDTEKQNSLVVECTTSASPAELPTLFEDETPVTEPTRKSARTSRGRGRGCEFKRLPRSHTEIKGRCEKV